MLFGGGAEALDGDEVGAFGAASVDGESEGADGVAVGGFESGVGGESADEGDGVHGVCLSGWCPLVGVFGVAQPPGVSGDAARRAVTFFVGA